MVPSVTAMVYVLLLVSKGQLLRILTIVHMLYCYVHNRSEINIMTEVGNFCCT